MAKTYSHQGVEERLYEFWESNGYFVPKIDPDKAPFTIIMPPPNVTGELHLGHAITATIEDILIRYHRMKGDPTLWLPGTDHASIAAQNVVEKELAKEGLTRHDLGREKFLERMWQWMDLYRPIIRRQHKRLGASCDWNRECFTMDPGPARAVRTTFKKLYDKGLIYRGEYIINWCPRCTTALSDLEVDHEDVEGKLYYVRYPLVPTAAAGEPEYITVATTRPETILGDTAVAVNPQDKRYQDLVGRKAILPEIGREILIIADEAVDTAFGTGAVKVTPFHDPVDYEISLRHNLPKINILNPDGTMNENAGQYAGLDRYECRRRLIIDLDRDGLLVKTEEHRHSIGHCQRCRSVVEPIVSKQWFVKIKPLAEPAMVAVREGKIKIIPERFEKIYFNWMENIRDWCISRQLWWGHRLPVWYCRDCGETTVTIEETLKTCNHCGSTNIEQDPDVLDTWFSSALWPFSTLGWPDETPDLAYFYPTSVMETGYDIIFFWVARMIMMGLEDTGQVPFRTVYLHGLVRDEKGEKMSKSKGNVVDPLVVMERYGTDALRFTLSTGSTPGNDMKLSPDRLVASRNFANKLWNASRFVLLVLEENRPTGGQLSLADRWIVSRLNGLIVRVTKLIEDFQLGEAGRQIHDFFWGEFCDWYIEMAKVDLRRGAEAPAPQVLSQVLKTSLTLLHPYMPFVTEEIWRHLPESETPLIVTPWPAAGPLDEASEAQMAHLIAVIKAIRNTRMELEVEPAHWIEAILVSPKVSGSDEAALYVAQLARVKPLTIIPAIAERPSQAVTLIVEETEVFLPLAGLVDLEKEKEKLSRALHNLEAQIFKSEKLLANENFTAKAARQVVDQERAKLGALSREYAKLKEKWTELGLS